MKRFPTKQQHGSALIVTKFFVVNVARFTKSQDLLKTSKCFKFGKQNEHVLKIKPTFCEDHPDEVIKLYCLDNKNAICMMFLATQHQNHKCAEINNMAEKFREVLQKDIETIGERTRKHSRKLMSMKRGRCRYLNKLFKMKIKFEINIKS